MSLYGRNPGRTDLSSLTVREREKERESTQCTKQNQKMQHGGTRKLFTNGNVASNTSRGKYLGGEGIKSREGGSRGYLGGYHRQWRSINLSGNNTFIVYQVYILQKSGLFCYLN